jgi:phage baseplate assembly protein W
MDPESERGSLRRRLLGWSVSLPEIIPGLGLGRDLELIRRTGGLDLKRVEGMDNLAQSLAVALSTLLGTDIFNTGFGFDGLNAMAEETDPLMIRERIRIAVIEVLRRDPRVRRIIDVKLGDDRLETPLAGSRELQVRVSFETVSGDQQTIELGRMVPHV